MPAESPSPKRPREATVTPIRRVPEPTPMADPGTITDLAHGLTDGALHCRAYARHDWRPARVTRELYGFRKVEHCTDCGSSRWQELDSRGYVVKQGLQYSDGYLNPKGTGRIGQDGRATYRLVGLDRLLGRAKSKKFGAA